MRLDRVRPGSISRCQREADPLGCAPLTHFTVLVAVQVVQDHVNRKARVDAGPDRLQGTQRRCRSFARFQVPSGPIGTDRVPRVELPRSVQIVIVSRYALPSGDQAEPPTVLFVNGPELIERERPVT